MPGSHQAYLEACSRRSITGFETIEIASSLADRQVALLLVTRDRRPSMRRVSDLTLSQSRWANVRYFAHNSQFDLLFRIISVMLWGASIEVQSTWGPAVWRSSETVGFDRKPAVVQAFGFRRTPSTMPLRKLTAGSHLVPEPIVEFGALAAVTDIRGMKESQDLRRSSSPIPARLTGDDLDDGPRSARFHNLRSANLICNELKQRPDHCRTDRLGESLRPD
jgi:hypothetical protein